MTPLGSRDSHLARVDRLGHIDLLLLIVDTECHQLYISSLQATARGLVIVVANMCRYLHAVQWPTGSSSCMGDPYAEWVHPWSIPASTLSEQPNHLWQRRSGAPWSIKHTHVPCTRLNKPLVSITITGMIVVTHCVRFCICQSHYIPGLVPLHSYGGPLGLITNTMIILPAAYL